jgi:rod shape-determining protein MreB and related proteins
VLAKRIGIDVGSRTLQVFVRGGGMLVDESSLCAVREESDELVAWGRDAEELRADPPPGVRLTPLLGAGDLAPAPVVGRLLRRLVAEAQGAMRLFRPEVTVAVPSWLIDDQRRVIVEAVIAAGARHAWVLDRPVAAAIGEDVPLRELKAKAVCDIGAETTDLALLSRSGTLVARSVRLGGRDLDAAITDRLARQEHLLVGEPAVERLRQAVGAAIAPHLPMRAEVSGHDAVTGLARDVVVSSSDVAQAMREPLGRLVGEVKAMLAQTPEEHEADVVGDGMLLSGGAALLRALDRYLSDQVGLRVRLAAAPRECVARGAALGPERFDVIRRGTVQLR